ncbi:addiction module antidote protein [Paracoccus sanguinis]|uniref:Probable addiction module antidote protein n=1 Tax=Paracoccus sanguinis TaxID=1545044 RepID=A0A1H3CED3_9RHOB|nr:addiction module antidote protein [Paracoccus sanguinis]KGJ18052.1 transcriptional regulator [Paracoccus sanguinis]SDX52507.1 probable addiction module antidote protein [Paracoccus sanguinis]
MNTIFIGGSRHVSRLPSEVKKRLDNVVASGHRVIVGDANGADKAVQKHFHDIHYDKVTVFCSGATPRNNLGPWLTHHVDAPKNAKGFQFYAAKDREMAREADFGLMIWDGKSPGTVLNVLRLAIAGKIAVLFNVPDKDVVNIKSVDAWRNFIAHCSDELRRDVKERATPDEWRLVETSDQPTFLPAMETAPSGQMSDKVTGEADVTPELQAPVLEEVVKALNEALARSDETAIKETLGQIARDRGMSQVARETGLARESLYRSLDPKGNPEFTTVLKVLSSIGLRLEVKPEQSEREPVASHG